MSASASIGAFAPGLPACFFRPYNQRVDTESCMILSVASRDCSPATGLISDPIPSRYLYRFLNKHVPAGYDTAPLFIYWGLLLAWLLPWSVFLSEAIRSNIASD